VRALRADDVIAFAFNARLNVCNAGTQVRRERSALGFCDTCSIAGDVTITLAAAVTSRGRLGTTPHLPKAI